MSNANTSIRQRSQHYVSAMLLKQWGDVDEGRDTQIAYYDMHRRTTEVTTAADECVAEGMTYFTEENEQEWGRVESDAAPVLDSVRLQMQQSSGRITRAIELQLMAPKNKAILCRLVALHHGRNLSVVLDTWEFAQSLELTPVQTREYLQRKIERRVQDAEERYLGAVQFCDHQESELVIGSIPVLDRQTALDAGWADVPAEFIMPLSPYLTMVALAVPLRAQADEMPPVAHQDRETTEQGNFGQVGVRGTNRVYCRPSNASEASELVGYLSHGGFWHWTGLKDRWEAYGGRLSWHNRTAVKAHVDWFFRTSNRLRFDGPAEDGTTFPVHFQEEAKSRVWETEHLMRELPPPEPLSNSLRYA